MAYVPPAVIDADAHVIETEHTWDFLEPSEAKYRPKMRTDPANPGFVYWDVNGVRGPQFLAVESPDGPDTRAQQSSRRIGTPAEARQLHDVSARLNHMNALGIDIQVLHATMWLYAMTHDPDAEAALTRSWNKWLAETWKASDNRLPWSCLIPTLLPDEAIVQLRWAKDHGAVAVFTRPYEQTRVMTDPYFYPVLAEIERLDMSMAVHIANGNQTNVDYLTRALTGNRALQFSLFRLPTVASCLFLLMSEIPKLFPKLRWGFIEASAQWLPWIYLEAARRYETMGLKAPPDLFERCNIFVTCQTDDDLPWVLKYAGEHCLTIGTDYGHGDPSSDIDATVGLRNRTDIGDLTKDNILYNNPKKLFALKLKVPA